MYNSVDWNVYYETKRLKIFKERRKNMKLTLKHVAIFGRIIVDTQGLNGSFYKTATLLELYKDGWFVTERFGTVICMCKKKVKDGFMSRCRHFKTDVNINTFDLLWKELAEQQFEKYKKYLLGETKKVVADEN